MLQYSYFNFISVLFKNVWPQANRKVLLVLGNDNISHFFALSFRNTNGAEMAHFNTFNAI